MDKDGFISNGELFTVLKMMVGNNLTDLQLQQLVDRTIIKADLVRVLIRLGLRWQDFICGVQGDGEALGDRSKAEDQQNLIICLLNHNLQYI